MNPLVLQIANGNGFFFGMALAVGAAISLRKLRGQWTRSALRLTGVLGVLLVILSATPLPTWLIVAWCVAGLIALPRPRSVEGSTRAPGVRLAFLAALVLLSVGLCIAEARYHVAPEIAVARGRVVYVMGDSLSSGLGAAGEKTWPEVLAERTGLSVTNVARAGATADSALSQVGDIAQEGCLVLVEIGGNDLLGGVSSQDFRARLDHLLGRLREGEHEVVLFELPLPPFHNGYGAAQRELAKKHGATLIPKRCLTRALGAKDGTLDGLHLSNTGHQALADAVREMLVIESP